MTASIRLYDVVALTVDASLRARAVTGGTAPVAVRRSLALARTLVARG